MTPRQTSTSPVRRAALVAGALLAACFDPHFRDPTCGPGSECPRDMVCSAGPGTACVRPGGAPDGAAPDDAAANDAAPDDAAASDAAPDSTPDAAPDASGGPIADARVDGRPPDAGPPCDDTRPFGEPVLVRGAVNTDADERGATLAADELTLYFSRAVPGRGHDVYVATRASRGDDWGPAAPLAIASSAADEARPSLLRDGTSLVLASSATGGGDIHGSFRADPRGDFPALQPSAALNDPSAADLDPFYASDGQIYWVRAGRLYETRKPSGVGPLDGDLPRMNVRAPVLSDSRFLLYFSHDDGNGAGADVWLARRYDTDDLFAQPHVQQDLSWPAGADDQPEWISSDQCRIYLSSNRPGGAGFDLWVAERTPP